MLLLAADAPMRPSALVATAKESGLRVTESWNVSSILKRSNGLAVNTSKGWSITEDGRRYLSSKSIGVARPAATKMAAELRLIASRVKDPQTRSFLDECIQCFELRLLRSAVVMSWLAAVDVLQGVVWKHHLAAFNAEGARIYPKNWKPIKHKDDFGRLKEFEFLTVLGALPIVSKDVKKELQSCLDRRNSCGHPNSLKLGASTIEHHLEILLLNVFEPHA